MLKIFTIVTLISCQVTAFVNFYSGGNIGGLTSFPFGFADNITKKQETFLMMAERKRRKRKDGVSYSPPNSSSPSSSFVSSDVNNQDLPEFDLIEEEGDSATATLEGNESRSTSLSKNSFNVNDPQVQDAMMASTTNVNNNKMLDQGLSSTKDLLRSRNRELEQKLVVNDITENVPSLAEYTKNKSKGAGIRTATSTATSSTIGKKAARREERISAALEAKKLQDGTDNQGGFFLNAFSFGKDKDGNPKTPIKLLEEGTWACIWILIAWEVFINSPFFERQGSMPPIVFQEVSELFLM